MVPLRPLPAPNYNHLPSPHTINSKFSPLSLNQLQDPDPLSLPLCNHQLIINQPSEPTVSAQLLLTPTSLAVTSPPLTNSYFPHVSSTNRYSSTPLSPVISDEQAGTAQHQLAASPVRLSPPRPAPTLPPVQHSTAISDQSVAPTSIPAQSPPTPFPPPKPPPQLVAVLSQSRITTRALQKLWRDSPSYHAAQACCRRIFDARPPPHPPP